MRQHWHFTVKTRKVVYRLIPHPQTHAILLAVSDSIDVAQGPLQAVYQARLIKHLQNTQQMTTPTKRVWVFCGDGEMDEPESLSGLKPGQS